MCKNQHDIILLWKVFFKNEFFQNSIFCDFLGGTSGRIPSCLNAPSRISQLLGDNSCSLILLCETPTYLYWDPGSEVEALLQKQRSRQQVLNAIFCETEVHSVPRLYSMIFTCWMQYHYHIYLKSFSAVAQKKSFLITQSGKSLGDQSFPMSWKGCIRRDGEVKDSYCSAAGQILYSTPCRLAVSSTGLLCSPGQLNTPSAWKNYSGSRKRNFLLRLWWLFSILLMVLNVPLVSIWDVEQQRVDEVTKLVGSLKCILYLYLAQAAKRRTPPVVFARKPRLPLRNNVWDWQACLPKCRRSWNLEMRELL